MRVYANLAPSWDLFNVCSSYGGQSLQIPLGSLFLSSLSTLGFHKHFYTRESLWLAAPSAVTLCWLGALLVWERRRVHNFLIKSLLMGLFVGLRLWLMTLQIFLSFSPSLFLSLLLSVSFFSFLPPSPSPSLPTFCSIGNFWARDRIRAAAVACDTAVATPDP